MSCAYVTSTQRLETLRRVVTSSHTTNESCNTRPCSANCTPHCNRLWAVAGATANTHLDHALYPLRCNLSSFNACNHICCLTEHYKSVDSMQKAVQCTFLQLLDSISSHNQHMIQFLSYHTQQSLHLQQCCLLKSLTSSQANLKL